MQLTLKCDWLIVKLSLVNYIYSQLSLFLIYNTFEKVFQQEIWLLQYEYLQLYLSAIHICGEMLIIIYFGTAFRLFAVWDSKFPSCEISFTSWFAVWMLLGRILGSQVLNRTSDLYYLEWSQKQV
jgi:hypothetical protein